MKLAPARAGVRLQVKKKTVPFSLWPTVEAHRNRHRLQSTLLALDPWAIIERVINSKCPGPQLDEARACLAQAKDFYNSASQAGALEARPLSLYYSYMNIVKAFCLTKNQQITFDKAQHGLSEQIRAGNVELVDAYLRAFPSPNGRKELQNFDEFKTALTGVGLGAPQDFNLMELLPQVAAAHRLWCAASESGERFIAIMETQYWHDPDNKTMWLRLRFKMDDLTRHNVSRTRLLKESGLSKDFKLISVDQLNDKSIATIEQKTPISYKGYPSDKLKELSGVLKERIWTIATTTSPYRKHYLYLCPTEEETSRLPQLLTIYAISYYLGSITRYRPHHYPNIVQKEYGAFIQDFITGQPQQFLYLMASWFAEQDVAKPGILV